MATAEFAAAAAGAHPPPHHPLAHAVMGQPMIDMGLNHNGDSVDSRKRPLDLDGEVEAGFAKRTHVVMSPPPTVGGDESKYILKMLIPSTAAGSIIGKAGVTIAQLQRDTGTNIKLSKANDFYPGTTERVALITGTVEALNNVCAFIIEKVKESPQLAAKTGSESITPPERARQVKVVVPNSTAGLIIGKGGSMIKSIMEQSSARVQISQKSDGITLTERVITVTGEVDANKKALSFIVAKCQEDPQSGSCNNLSYAAISGPVANANPTGSPFAEAVAANLAAIAAAKQQNIPMPTMSFPGGLPTALPSPSVATAGVTLSPSPHLTSARMPSSLPQMMVPSMYSPASDAAAVSAAMNTLASYNYGINTMAGLPHGIGATSPLLGATAPQGLHPSMFSSSLLGSPYGHFAKATPPTPAAAAAAALEGAVINGQHHHQAPHHPHPEAQPQPPGTPHSMMQIPITAQETIVPSVSPLGQMTVGGIPITIGSPEPIKDPTKSTVLEVEVPETLVGAILGKGGKTLVEFQNYSGAKIQISKKGEYIPGTRNRKVTITGAPTAAQTAHFLVAQRVAQEEQTRALKGQT